MMKTKFIIILHLALCNCWLSSGQLGAISLGAVTLSNTTVGSDSSIGKSNLPVCTPDNYSCFPLTTITYTFIGAGSWNIKTNWLNNLMPPPILPAGTEIIINGAKDCILDDQQTISPYTKLTIMPGKKLQVSGVLKQ